MFRTTGENAVYSFEIKADDKLNEERYLQLMGPGLVGFEVMRISRDFETDDAHALLRALNQAYLAGKGSVADAVLRTLNDV